MNNSSGANEVDEINSDIPSTSKSDTCVDTKVADCSVCLQACVHPTQLPDCGHVFCFLCLKGAASRSGRCPLCRSVVPPSVIANPQIVKQISPREGQVAPSHRWFYEGRDGWWEYEERYQEELEKAHTSGVDKLELLIAGHMYIIDFREMVQRRRDRESRRRRIRRAAKEAELAVKGVAGIAVDQLTPEDLTTQLGQLKL